MIDGLIFRVLMLILCIMMVICSIGIIRSVDLGIDTNIKITSIYSALSKVESSCFIDNK